MVAQVKPDALATIDDPDFPHNLSVGDAKLPVVYESAKTALAECSRIDECKDWADKAEALASYARQADDDTLRNMAMRIQARAIRRCGDLLKEIEDSNRGRKPKIEICTDTDTNLTRSKAAKEAGLSKRQKDTALRVASIPVQEFESVVESDAPPTVTRLAEIGTKPQPKTQRQKASAVVEIFPQASGLSAHSQPKAGPQPLVDLKGRAPGDFESCRMARGNTERFDEFAAKTSPASVVRGASDLDRVTLAERAVRIIKWLQQLQKELA